MIKHSQYPEGTKHGSGYVTSASDGDDHRAHKIILQALSQFPQNRNDSSKDTKYGFGDVTSASGDDHYHAHKIILAAASQFLKAKTEIIDYSLLVQDLCL